MSGIGGGTVVVEGHAEPAPGAGLEGDLGAGFAGRMAKDGAALLEDLPGLRVGRTLHGHRLEEGAVRGIEEYAADGLDRAGLEEGDGGLLLHGHAERLRGAEFARCRALDHECDRLAGGVEEAEVGEIFTRDIEE